MKMLMTADPIGGVWTYALELARSLPDVEITIATMGRPLTAQQWQQVHQISSLQVVESDFKLEWMAEPWEDVQRSGAWLLHLAEQVQPDLVHLNGYVHAALPWQLPVVVVAHSCVLSWWQAVNGDAAPAEWQPYQQAVERGLKACDRVIAPSQSMLQALHQHYEFTTPECVIYNGRNPTQFASTQKTNGLFSMGRFWDAAKNLMLLEQAAPKIHAPIYIAGEVQSLQQRPIETQTLHYLGQLDSHAIATWLASTSVYVLPARYEPFGLSILEAALAECALVLGDIPSLREIWESAALFVSPTDADQLQSTLNWLLSQPEICALWGSQARSRALQFTSQHMASDYRHAYQELLHSQSNSLTCP